MLTYANRHTELPYIKFQLSMLNTLTVQIRKLILVQAKRYGKYILIKHVILVNIINAAVVV